MHKKEIVIIGAGGLAYECYNYINRRIAAGDESIAFKGFTSADYSGLQAYGLDEYFLTDYNTCEFSKETLFVIGVGSPDARKRIFEEFKEKGYSFYNLVAPTAIVAAHLLENSQGNIFAEYSTAFALEIGNANLVGMFSGIAHHCKMGSFNVISGTCGINGGCVVGDCNFMGTHSALLPKAKLGNSNKIAAGSIVYKGCKNNMLMQGNPAEKVGDA